ncbi:MAG TPA: hypothetical protein VES42_15505 [Pilimelia sp.]|nr:hypothetical protein [Pilimelia sp.]
MPFRRFLVLLAALATTLIVASPAAAQPYPAEPPAGSVSAGTVAPGGDVTFSGEGFIPGESIDIIVSYADGSTEFLGTVTANSAGRFSVTVTLSKAGAAVLAAIGETSGVTVTAAVTVLGAADEDDAAAGGSDDTAGDGWLPITGNNRMMLATQLGVGVAALILGAALLRVSTRRRRRHQQ